MEAVSRLAPLCINALRNHPRRSGFLFNEAALLFTLHTQSFSSLFLISLNKTQPLPALALRFFSRCCGPSWHDNTGHIFMGERRFLQVFFGPIGGRWRVWRARCRRSQGWGPRGGGGQVSTKKAGGPLGARLAFWQREREREILFGGQLIDTGVASRWFSRRYSPNGVSR